MCIIFLGLLEMGRFFLNLRMFGFTMEPYVAGWFLMITSRVAAIAGFGILTVVLAVLIKYNVHVRWKEIMERKTWGK